MAQILNRYSRAQIALHWGIALLLVASYASSDWLKELWIAYVRGNDFSYSIGAYVHIVVGVLIFALVLVRIVVRRLHGVPPEAEAGSDLLKFAARVGHGLIYIVLLLIPLSGMVAWFAGVRNAGDAHEILFNIGMALVILHVAAALYHQFVLKDNLIARMR